MVTIKKAWSRRKLMLATSRVMYLDGLRKLGISMDPARCIYRMRATVCDSLAYVNTPRVYQEMLQYDFESIERVLAHVVVHKLGPESDPLPADQAAAELEGVREMLLKHQKLLLLCYSYYCAKSQGSAFTMDVAAFRLFIQVRTAGGYSVAHIAVRACASPARAARRDCMSSRLNHATRTHTQTWRSSIALTSALTLTTANLRA